MCPKMMAPDPGHLRDQRRVLKVSQQGLLHTASGSDLPKPSLQREQDPQKRALHTPPEVEDLHSSRCTCMTTVVVIASGYKQVSYMALLQY